MNEWLMSQWMKSLTFVSRILREFLRRGIQQWWSSSGLEKAVDKFNEIFTSLYADMDIKCFVCKLFTISLFFKVMLKALNNLRINKYLKKSRDF